MVNEIHPVMLKTYNILSVMWLMHFIYVAWKYICEMDNRDGGSCHNNFVITWCSHLRFCFLIIVIAGFCICV